MKKIIATFALAFLAAASFAADIPRVVTECGPWVMGVTDDAMTVVWISSDRSIGWVEIAPDDGASFYAEERPRHYEDFLGRHVVSKLHRVRVAGLQAGTTYRYRIYQQGIDDSGAIPVLGTVTASDVYSREPYRIRTLDSRRDECRFMVVNDIHGRDSILTAHARAMRKADPDFVVFNGDMSNLMGPVSYMEEAYLARAVKEFATDTPLFFVRGNHETRGSGAAEFMNLYPSHTGKPYYMFRQGPAVFLVLDSGEDKPDNDIEYGGTAAYDAYREAEAEWLREAVGSEEFRSAPVKVALLHVPPEKGRGWHGSNELKRLIIPVLNEAGVDVMLSGHLHRHDFRKAGECGTDFPVVVNSNNDRLEVRVTSSRIEIDVVDAAGKTLHRHEIDVK